MRACWFSACTPLHSAVAETSPISKVASCIGCRCQWLRSAARTQSMRLMLIASNSPHEPRMKRDLPIQRRGKPGAMGDHQQAAAGMSHQIARKRKHAIRGGLVEVAGRLIGEQ